MANAWKKQAIPLVFIDVGMNSIKTDDPVFMELYASTESAVALCWKFLNASKCRIPDDDALKITMKSAERIQKALESDVWGVSPIKCIGEITNAMVGIADDTLRQMPMNNVERWNAWDKLTSTLAELVERSQTVDIDDRCYGIASKIADLVREESDK